MDNRIPNNIFKSIRDHYNGITVDTKQIECAFDIFEEILKG